MCRKVTNNKNNLLQRVSGKKLALLEYKFGHIFYKMYKLMEQMSIDMP